MFKVEYFFQIWTLKATLKEVKYFTETRGWMSVCKSRVVFRTQSSIYDVLLYKNS